MSKHKYMDKICVVAVVVAMVLCMAVMNGEALGIGVAPQTMGYEDRIFDTAKVHTIDIVIDDWDAFLATARSEEYSVCDVVIDGEAVRNVGIRGKGNTSLSTVASMGSDRYSFKIEFDQYDSTKTYHGLDKLSLNNVIQDNTYMKDYLTYRMMAEFGAAAPLCSFAYLTVNGEAWGLYLAVEAVEESFLQRNYGSDYGELYKPDNMDMGGGRGNGKDFEMPDFGEMQGNMPEGFEPGNMPEGFEPGNMPEGFEPGSMPEGFEPGSMPEGFEPGNMPGGFGGMGSSETKLQYIDDDPASYAAIFGSVKTDITDADKERLVASLKQLSQYENLEEVLLTEDVLRYFVVHNYVVNGDSYTGNMIHNYYLYEEDGRLSMIPWDYNLAFGTFMGGNAASSVNAAIDDVLSDRPMQAWIFSDEVYTEQYYSLYSQFVEQVNVQTIIDEAQALIAPYVEKDPTAFCTYEEFETAVDTIKRFCALRTESIRLQLAGSTETVDVGDLNLSAMGTMGGGFGGRGDFGGMKAPEEPSGAQSDRISAGQRPDFGGMERPGDMTDARQTTGFANTGAILLGVTLLFLAVGLIVAFKFKK